MTRSNVGDRYDQWRHWHIEQNGFPDEPTWVLSCLRHDNEQVVHAAVPVALDKSRDRALPVVIQLMGQHQTHSAILTAGIRSVRSSNGYNAMAALAHLINADQAKQMVEERVLDCDFSFPERLVFHRIRRSLQGRKPRSVSELRQDWLKHLAGQDFGEDAEAWLSWPRGHHKPDE